MRATSRVFFAPNQIGLGGAAVEFAKQHDERFLSECGQRYEVYHTFSTYGKGENNVKPQG